MPAQPQKTAQEAPEFDLVPSQGDAGKPSPVVVEVTQAALDTKGSLEQLMKIPEQPMAPSQDGQVVASVPVEEPPTAPTYERYRVKQDCYVQMAGIRTTIRRGKVVDTRNYDVEQLRKAGVELEQV